MRNQFLITSMLFAIWGGFMFLAPQAFTSRGIYISFMSTIPFITIVAVGMTLVVVTGEMDLSFASNMALSGFIFAVVTKYTGLPILGIAAGLAGGVGIGLLNGLVIVGTGVPAIVATIGFDFLWRGFVMLVSGGIAIPLPMLRESGFVSIFASELFGVIPMQTLWALVFAGVTSVMLHRTSWGDNLRFIGDNVQAAAMMGLPVKRSRVAVFAYLGFAASFAGILSVMEMANWWPTQGEGYLLLVFASVFIGGTSVYGGNGTVWGSLIGSVIIGIIEAGIVSSGWSGFWTRFVHGFILLVSVSFYALAARSRRE